MAALDFIVGGIPRGGTTAFADAFNQHPEIYCHASETHLLPFAAEIAATSAVTAAAVPAVCEELRRRLRINLIELVEFNLQLGSPMPDLRFSDRDIDLLAVEMTRPLGEGCTGLAYANQLGAILARELRQRSGKRVVGEKTPSNVLALDRLGWNATRAASPPVFVVVRRPFAVINSMQVRLANPEDVYSANFSGNIAEQAGYFVRHALACARLVQAGAQLYRYENLNGNPQLYIRKALDSIGVAGNDRIAHSLAQTINFRGLPDSRSQFTSRDQALIDAITRPALDQLGYGRDPASQAEALAMDCGWHVIAGMYPDGLVERRSVVLLVTEQQHSRAVLQVWHRFPPSVAGADTHVGWTVHATDGRPLATGSAMGSGPATIELAFDLDAEACHCCSNGNLLLVVELCCTHDFVPMAHPDAQDGASTDVRAISGQLLHVEFD
ncbi:sulfotransferase [Sandarakinorhabdus sp.]|uniref:sulfotransferase n=1 Tax=Sandarakinorhabdus sp. TaxID=1916663 RepID=UPI00286E7736|nr:sulfotransferase [Sandarakinorhabdus sp.]